MNHFSSALINLEVILEKVVAYQSKGDLTGSVLLRLMDVPLVPENLLLFYNLLINSEKEALKIYGHSKIDMYIQSIKELHSYCVSNHLWAMKLNVFSSHIKSRNVLTTINALANYYSSQNPQISLEGDLLGHLSSEFESLLEKVKQSDLSQELRNYLCFRIEDIIKALSRYSVDGTEVLVNSVKLSITDLAIIERNLKESDKKNSLLKKFQGVCLSVALWFTPSPYDVVGIVPDLYEFWVPTLQEFIDSQKQIEKIIDSDDKLNILSVLEKSQSAFPGSQKRLISG